jgi:hypothetical protein
MGTVKTGVSINEHLFRQAEHLAGRMGISRSRLFSQAVEEFLERHEGKELLRRINKAHEDYPDSEDSQFVKVAKHSTRRLLERDPW